MSLILNIMAPGASPGAGSMSPGEALKQLKQLKQTPGQHGIVWEALSDYLRDILVYTCGRDDLAVYCMPGGGAEGAAGFYAPTRGLISIEGDLLPVEPHRLDMNNQVHFDGLATLYGVYLHETGHAIHTIFLPYQYPKHMQDVASEMALLEEPRMEAQTVRRAPRQRLWLRKSSLHLDLGSQLKDLAGYELREAIWKAVLVEGRVEAGVLTARDTAELTKLLDASLPADVRTKLRSICKRAVAISDRDLESLEKVARELKDLLPPDESECGFSLQIAGDGSGEGDGQGQSPQSGSELAQAIMQAASDALSQSSESAGQELQKSGMGGMLDTMAAEIRDQVNEALADALKNKALPELPDKPWSDASAASPSAPQPETDSDNPFISHASAATNQPIQIRKRAPTPREKRRRKELSKALKRVRFRNREVSRRGSLVPPGRLRTRSAIQFQAQIAAGQMPSAMPWERSKHIKIESPKVRCVTMADTSGSMSSKIKRVSAANWVISNAVRENEGRTLGIAFGDDVSIVCPSHRPMDSVLEFKANGGTEYIDSGLQLAYNEMDLGNPAGSARLVVIISDGHWNSSQGKGADVKLQWLMDQGVKVLMVDFGSEPARHPCHARVAITTDNDLVKVIGDAIVELLSEDDAGPRKGSRKSSRQLVGA